MTDHDATTTTAPADSTPATGRHPVNIAHLVMGVALLGLAVIWALIQSGTASASDLRWLLPVPWVAAGAVGLAASTPRLRTGRR